LRAANWLEAMSELKKGHAPDDDNTISLITEKLMPTRLGEREAASTLINRMLELNATLTSLGKPMEEIHLVTAMKKALSQNTHYKETLRTLTTVGGHQSIRALQMAFNSNVSSLVVPGAFLCDADMDHQEQPDSISLLAKQVKNLQHQFKKARKPIGGRGTGGRGDQPSGRGGRGGRGGRKTRGARKTYSREDRKTVCYNCGDGNHLIKDCKKPCGMCGKSGHVSYECILNPRSSNYVPVAQRNGGKFKGKPQALMTTETTDPDPEEGYANMANAEVFHPFSEDHMEGTDDSDDDSGELNPPDTWLPCTGIATVASVLSPNDELFTKWILDGGASHHFTPIKSVLHNYKADDPARPYRVKVANKQYAVRAGVGSIKITTYVEGKTYDYEIHEVWHMPTFAHSLLSANKLKAQGNWRFSGRKGDMNEYFVSEKHRNVWLVCEYVDGLNYPLWKLTLAPDFKCGHKIPVHPKALQAEEEAFIHWPHPPDTPLAASANRATDKESAGLWHQRLGHIRMRDLQNLVSKKRITGIKIASSSILKHDSKKCQTCIMAKYRRSKLTSPRTPTDIPMHTLHSDLQGPFSNATLAGGKYVVSLLDEATGKGGVSITKTKDADVDELRRMILLWEAETQKKCCVLFTDRGGEYTNSLLKEWCLSKSIVHHYSVPRTPEQNGRAERFNQTITNICRALLFNYKLKDSLWGHAMIYACMIYNVCMNKRLGMTRHEAFFGKIPDVTNFRTFGCKVYAHVPHTTRKKLEPKYQLGIFLGPETEGPGYKVLTYNEKLKRDKYQVRIFRDIVTFENLKAVTGAHDESQLHWGGHIDLPEGEEVDPALPELEPLTGVPELQAPLPENSAPECVVSERQLALPGPGGAERILELVVADEPAQTQVHPAPREVNPDTNGAQQLINQTSMVDGDGRPQRHKRVSSQSPTEQVPNGDNTPPVLDTVAHGHVTPTSVDKEVPSKIHVTDSENVTSVVPTKTPTGERASKKPKTAASDKSSDAQRDARANELERTLERSIKRTLERSIKRTLERALQRHERRSRLTLPSDSYGHAGNPQPPKNPLRLQKSKNRLLNRWECQTPR
jgi:hypothetical protein